MKTWITKALEDRQIDMEDPEENPFHDSLKDFDMVLSGAKKRTTEAENEGASLATQTLILIDDLLGGYRNNKVLEIAFTRSRHWGCNIVILSQVLRGLSPVIRKNLTHVALWRLSKLEENSAYDEFAGTGGTDPALFMKAFHLATAKPHGFLWMKMGSPPEFYSSFTKRLVSDGRTDSGS